MPKSTQYSPLNCATSLPANADGCCCLEFQYFGSIGIPGTSTVIPAAFIFYEQLFVLPDPAVRAFYLKIEKPEIDYVFYENNIPWFDDMPDCNDYTRVVFFPWFPVCQGNIVVTAKKVYKLNPSDPFSSCAETTGEFFYLPTPPPLCID